MILLLGGEKGGTGKSTLATNLAVWLAHKGRDVILVDTDCQRTSSHFVDRRNELGTLPRIHCAEKYGNVFDTVKDLATRYEYVLVDAGGRDSEELRTAMVVAHKLCRSGCRRSLIGPGIRTGFASPNGCRKGSCWKS